MDFDLLSDDPLKVEAQLLAFGVFEADVTGQRSVDAVDRALDGLVTRVAAEEGFRGKQDQSLLLHTHDRLPASRLLLVGLGSRDAFDLPNLRGYGARVVAAARSHRCARAAALVPPVDATAQERAVQHLVEGAILGGYRFDRYISDEERKREEPVAFTVLCEPGAVGVEPVAVARGELAAAAVGRARDLVNEPAGALTPERLAEAARAIARDAGLTCTVLGPAECAREGMGLFLAVAQGSAQEPRFIHLTYRPRGKARPARRYVLVGKGVTFDSGGLSLKPTSGMLDMKMDMAGAAAVLGVMSALPALGISAEVHGIVAAAENMVSGSSYKLGDVITGKGGKSVEIHNTDAEGRLTLADALAYAVALEPDEIIDLATLTGACMVALGPHMAGVMGSDLALVERFLGAARRAGEEMWSLPLPARLKEMLKSEIADLKNVGERWGGALTAGLFLQEFVGETPWLHVDIAGPAHASKAWGHIPKGGTGFGVATVMEYLQSREQQG